MSSKQTTIYSGVRLEFQDAVAAVSVFPRVRIAMVPLLALTLHAQARRRPP